MQLQFTKMSGAGNDFICLDNRRKTLRLNRGQIARLCDRHFGIGADGLLILEAGGAGHDYRMRYHNADGGEAEMCGNGARCFARFAQAVTGTDKPKISFKTGAGIVTAEYLGDEVRVGLTPPGPMQLSRAIPTGEGDLEVHTVNTGVPHAVLFVKDVDAVDVLKLGAELRWHREFQPRGTNVNFAERLSGRKLRVRTYERGVEGETLACGTGVTAAALVAAEVFGIRSPIQVQVRGGDQLEVHFDGKPTQAKNVRLQGPATFVFDGEIHV
jgi:diaminopimelate epimerase